MSEFARQSHPDAADRERLAREIPGLSPRQVQVWFQNRYIQLRANKILETYWYPQTRKAQTFD